MTAAPLRLAVLHPDRMNLYADRGNVLVLEQRGRRRGLDLSVRGVGPGDELRPDDADLIYLGGGQDRDQRRCAEDLLGRRAALHEAVAGGAVVLGVCGGYQLLGHAYRTDRDEIPGVGLLDVVTEHGTDRAVGEVVVEVDAGIGGAGRRLTGFENHRGRTTLGPGARPLGRVVRGTGNDGVDGTEGAVAGRVVGTYLHGPLLARNVWLADRLLSWATGGPLAPLPDRFERLVHEQALRRATRRG